MENHTKYYNFYLGIEWFSLRSQEGGVSQLAHRLRDRIERDLNAWQNGEKDTFEDDVVIHAVNKHSYDPNQEVPF